MKNKKKIIIIAFLTILVIILGIISFKIYTDNYNKNKVNENKDISEITLDEMPQERKDQVAVVSKELASNSNVEIKDGIKVNNSEMLLKKSTIKDHEDLEVYNKTLTYENGNATFKAKFKNISNIDVAPFTFKIIFLNKENEVMGEFTTQAEYIMADGNEIEIFLIANTDVSNAYDVKFEVVEKYVYDGKQGKFVKPSEVIK